MPPLTSIGSMESGCSAEDLTVQPHPSNALGFPITDIKASEPYYHECYPLSAPGVDYILASSDLVSCRFAISSTKLAFQPEVFTSTYRAKIQWCAGLPLILMNASKVVIEIILACLDSSLVPDLSEYKFDDLGQSVLCYTTVHLLEFH